MRVCGAPALCRRCELGLFAYKLVARGLGVDLASRFFPISDDLQESLGAQDDVRFGFNPV